MAAASSATDRDCMLLRKLPARAAPGLRGRRGRRRPRAWSTGSTSCWCATRSPRGSPTTTRDDLHLHVATESASVAELLVGESLLGLATLVCDLGPTRLGVCSPAPCTNVVVDTSPNRSRRYCSDRCSSRANVAAYRARQKLAPRADADAPPRRRRLTGAGRSARTGPVGLPGERRPPDRPVRQDPAARDRPRARRGLPQGDRAVRRARALPRARAHLPADAAGAVERPRRRPRRRAGRRHAAGVQPVRRAARAARRRRRDDGPLRPAAAGEEPDPRAGAGLHRPAGARGGAARQEDRRACSATAIDDDTVVVHASERGNLKQALLKLGWPAEDFAGYVDGEAHPIFLDETEWHLRDYQREAAESFWHGGSGVVVLPCGAGKTLVGAAAMAAGQGDHADPGHQHRLRAAVEGRAGPAYLADRGRDRRVLRRRSRRSGRSPSRRTRC